MKVDSTVNKRHYPIASRSISWGDRPRLVPHGSVTVRHAAGATAPATDNHLKLRPLEPGFGSGWAGKKPLWHSDQSGLSGAIAIHGCQGAIAARP